MYPGFEDGGSKDPNPYSQNKPAQKKGTMTKEIETALYDIKSGYSLKSVKQLFSAFEIYFQMPIKNPALTPLSIRAVFFQGYPNQKPKLYSGRPLGHKLISETNGEIRYEELVQWTPKTRFIDIVNRVQNIFNTTELREDPFASYVEDYKRRLDQYGKDINSMTNTPIPPNPPQNYLETIKLPQPPVFNFDYLIKEKKYHSDLKNDVQSKAEIYETLLIDYKENESKAKYISERFGKGRILKEMEAAMENSELDPSIEGIENQLADFHNKRKNYHKMEILKQKYLES